MTKSEIITLLSTLGRRQRGPCEPTLVITESQAQAIISALTDPTPVAVPVAKKRGRSFGKTPE